jgi:general stress protein 26
LSFYLLGQIKVRGVPKDKSLKSKILNVMKGEKLASLATIASGRPWVRYAVSHNDGTDLNLYICTYKDSRKVGQIKKNPNVHITIGGNMDNLEAPYVQIAARARVRADAQVRKRFWSEFMRKYYTGPDDPVYVVIEARPEFIEYMSSETHTPQTYRVKKLSRR